jgi:adenylate cyclase
MSIETERKFLVIQEKLILPYSGKEITQGYLNSFPERSVRVRLSDNNGYLTIKSKTNPTGVSRYEWEREISKADAYDLFKLCEPGIISKTRYEITYGSHFFEIDVFHDLNKGLIMAEIELTDENECFDKPEWLGTEVTGDRRYYNSFLSKTPYTKW